VFGGGRARPSNPNTIQIEACSFQGVINVGVARNMDNETESFWLNTFLLRPFNNFKMNMSQLIPERKEYTSNKKKSKTIKQTRSESDESVFNKYTSTKTSQKLNYITHGGVYG
jgi:hypothetical protein